MYGRPAESANDKLMAAALDMQGDDTANKDPDSRVVVMHITPVPGAGVVHGAAFISEHEVFDPRLGSIKAPQVAQDVKVSVRGDLVIDPNGGSGPASVNGAATRFPSG